MKQSIFLLLCAVLLAQRAIAGQFDKCAEQLPLGIPKMETAIHSTEVCHSGYAALVDNDLLIPRWVGYTLTRDHTLGCFDRGKFCKFHPDEALDSSHRARPADYQGSGYDQGHLAPAADFSWDQGELYESCSMANITPQLPGLNRKEWERLEETVRSWAYDRGKLIIFVGPVVREGEDSIGEDRVSIPGSFWKVIIDPERKEALGFELKQADIPKGPL